VLAVWIFLAVIGYLSLGTIFARSVYSCSKELNPDHEAGAWNTVSTIIFWPLWLVYALVISALAYAGVKV
jgi:hypothetical protein